MDLVSGSSSLSALMDTIVEFISSCRSIIEAQNINFFVSSSWNILTGQFQEELLARFDELRYLPTGEMSATCSHDSFSDFGHCLSCFIRKVRANSLFHSSPCVTDLHRLDCYDLPRSGLVTKHPEWSKKDYEIDIMSSLIFGMLKRFQVDTVVDIGSGLGYLDSLLATSSDISCNVIGLEANQHCANKAQERHNSIVKDKCRECRREWNEQCRISSINGQPIGQKETKPCSHRSALSIKFRSVSVKVDSNLKIDKVVDETLPTNHGYMMAGLHTCGNLASDSLRLFFNSNNSVALCLMPCCHNLLSEFFDEEPVDFIDKTAVPGFPLSEHLYRKQFSLGYDCRQLGAQGPFKLKEAPAITVFYRALLQKLLFSHFGLVSDNWRVGRSSRAMTESFFDYVSGALERLSGLLPTNPPLPLNEWNRDYLLKYEQNNIVERNQLFAFYYLKMALSPCLESIIMLDKMLYILEHDNVKEFRVVKLFDPSKSPRCLALVVSK